MMWNQEMETMPRTELTALQLDRLQKVVNRVYERVPFYRRAFDERGLTPDHIRHLEDVRLLPFTKKSDLREHYPFGLFAEPLDRVCRIHASSGTKGKPTVVGYTRNDIQQWAEVCARSLCCGGARPGDVIHNAYGYGLFTGGLGVHYGAELMGATVIPVSGGHTQRQVMLLQDFQARILCCTPSYALNIADVMQDMGISPDALNLRYGIFGAESWSEEMRATIEQRLGITALDIYGLSEVIGPGVSMECYQAKQGLHIWEDHFLPEIIDPETEEVLPHGEEGELVITSLTKEAFPVIRYRTGDITSLNPEPCPCGRTHIRMNRIKGRSDDMLIIRGVNVFPSEIERILVGTPELSPHYQIVLRKEGALDRADVNVEVDPSFFAALGEESMDEETMRARPAVQTLQQRVERQLAETLGVRIHVHLVPPRTIPRSQGKAVRVVDQR